MTEKTFNQNDFDFAALHAARAWIRDQGYSYGSLCRDMPIGLLKGEWTIAKWKNLTDKERNQLDGQMTSSDFRNGPVNVFLKEIPTDVEIKLGKRIRQKEKEED